MNDSVEKHKSDIVMDVSVSKEKRTHTEDILLIPRPTDDPLDPLVQPLWPTIVASHANTD